MSVATLGCKVNQYDTDAMLGALSAAGFTVVDWNEQADVCIINTCTVTASADSKSRLLIHQAARRGIPVCVCGCLAQRTPNQVQEIEGVGAVVPLKDREQIIKTVAVLAGEDPPDTPAVLRPSGPRRRTRGFLKIQEGCNNACSYCVIRVVRGQAKTRPLDEIMRDARLLAADNVRELILTGIHISSYGTDSGASLTDLLHGLQQVDGIERLRLGSLDPSILNERTAEEFAGVRKLCPHFHVSLQSGCSRTLFAMNRHYTAEQYGQKIDLLRNVFDVPAITTDVMTGFPGESEDDFRESMRFVEQMQFARLHVFPYSEREGTPAAVMPGSVPVHVRRERGQRMTQLGRQMQNAFIDRFSGTVQNVLFDRAEQNGASGYTDRYVRVFVPGAGAGQLRRVLLESRSSGGFTGAICT